MCRLAEENGRRAAERTAAAVAAWPTEVPQLLPFLRLWRTAAYAGHLRARGLLGGEVGEETEEEPPAARSALPGPPAPWPSPGRPPGPRGRSGEVQSFLKGLRKQLRAEVQ
mmetsp:Transcript_107456/g.321389  ORF Transcript_107456/g.321389 Transcript_107456/m.321389 type:complete len:111 (+) Transcript_107456:1196-1528(+)